jgi:uncharacterized membrane-anchored protein
MSLTESPQRRRDLRVLVLGASIGDEMSQNSHKYGGLGLGTTGTSYILLSCILALVAYLSGPGPARSPS